MEGEDWHDRLRSWVPRGCDAWIVQREVQDVTQYAELWLRDAGDHRAATRPSTPARYDAWLDEFEARKTKAVGFGWITLRKSGADAPSVTVEEWPHPVEQPLGEAVVAHFDRQDYLRATTTRRCSPATSGSPTRWCRSRSGCPARRTPSMWCCARTAVCGGPRRWTRSARASRGCVTAR